MKVRARRLIAASAAVVLLTSLGAWVWLWRSRPRPTLDGVDLLIAERRYDAVEARLLAYLRAYPRDPAARLLLARAAVERPDPKPELALGQVLGDPPADRRLAAEFKSAEGAARFYQRRFDAAEAAWLAALRLDAEVPEAGWGLLNLYALQGRTEDARRLGLRLFAVEPDPHDRVQLLLQLVRHDAHAIAADSVVHQLEPVVRANPGDFHSAVALGLAMVHTGRNDDALALLGRVVESHGQDPDVWEAYLEALAQSGQVEALGRAVDRLPRALVGFPRFDAARGWLAAQRHDWPEAARAYLRAWEDRPTDASLAYRLELALRNGGRRDELERLAPRLRAAALAREKLRGLYDRLDALPDLGRVPRPQLYHEMAETLEQLNRRDEARAWDYLAGGGVETDPSVGEPSAPAGGSGMAGLARP
jgi:tetratricopeptide (TPR) repeat protein